MGKLVVFNMISVDGYFSRENGDIDWHTVDDEFNEFAIEHTASFGALMFGNTTYKIFEEYWPGALKDPKTGQEDRKIGQIIEDVKKYVFSKSRHNVTWNNSVLLKEITKEEITKIKKETEKDIAIFGSGTIVQQCANLGVVDEYRLLVSPTILGAGKPLFAGVTQKNLTLQKTRTFGNGNILLSYV